MTFTQSLLLMLSLWLGVLSFIGASAQARTYAAKKKSKKKTAEESSNRYENSKYFFKSPDTGGPYRFNASGEPIYPEPKAPKKKTKQRKKPRAKKQVKPAPSKDESKPAPEAEQNRKRSSPGADSNQTVIPLR